MVSHRSIDGASRSITNLLYSFFYCKMKYGSIELPTCNLIKDPTYRMHHKLVTFRKLFHYYVDDKVDLCSLKSNFILSNNNPETSTLPTDASSIEVINVTTPRFDKIKHNLINLLNGLFIIKDNTNGVICNDLHLKVKNFLDSNFSIVDSNHSIIKDSNRSVININITEDLQIQFT